MLAPLGLQSQGEGRGEGQAGAPLPKPEAEPGRYHPQGGGECCLFPRVTSRSNEVDQELLATAVRAVVQRCSSTSTRRSTGARLSSDVKAAHPPPPTTCFPASSPGMIDCFVIVLVLCLPLCSPLPPLDRPRFEPCSIRSTPSQGPRRGG